MGCVIQKRNILIKWDNLIILGEKVPVDQAERKPTVPKVTDHIATPMRTRRSFVHKNALEAMVSEPTALDNPQFVDAPQV